MANYKVISEYLHVCGYEFEKGDYLIIQEDEELEDGFLRAFDPLLGGEEPLTLNSRKYLGVVRQVYLDELVKNHEIRLETK
jgi:hypothetical protein